MPEETVFLGPEVEEDTIPEEEVLPVFRCPDCEEEYDDESEAEQCCWPSCSICAARHRLEEEADLCCQTPCPSCGELYEYESDAEQCCQYRCDSCGEYHEYESAAEECCQRSGGDPYYPTLPALNSPYMIEVPVYGPRTPRYISIEQELTGGGAAVAAMLYNEGLSSTDHVADYSYTPDRRGIAVCEDGSLPDDGGEVKYSKFDLSQTTDMNIMSKAVGRIRQLHKDAGIVEVGTRAGMHIHAAAKNVAGIVIGPMQMTALHELFSHGEDMIYGLAAAGWDRGHRYSGDGNDYAKPIPKMANKTPWKVAQVMGSKYYGVNFERLLTTVGRCSCGSVKFGAWSECECGAFDRATVEWRVFNTSTMPETIHAWVLFVSAVMAHAMNHTPGTLRDNAYSPRTNAEDDSRRMARWATLEWFLATIPLSPDERDVIRAAADRSPMMKKEV